MAAKKATKNDPLVTLGLGLAVLLGCYLDLMVYVDTYKAVALTVLAACVLLLVLPKTARALPRRLTVSWLPLLAYMVLCGVSILWAQSGKFFLKEYARLLIGFGMFLAIGLALPRTKKALWVLGACLAGGAAVFSAASVDLAGLGIFSWFWNSIDAYTGMENGFEAGTRLTGIFGNGNVLAGMLGIGIFLALACLESAETRPGRLYAAGVLNVCAFGFVLAFSMGATAFFLLGVLVYLAAAGAHRGRVLARMIFCALPTALLAFLAVPFFEKTGAALAVPGLLLLAAAAAGVGLEAAVLPRLAPRLEGRGRLTALLIGAILLALIGYVLAAVSLTGPTELSYGEALRRAVYPEAEDYTLEVSGQTDTLYVTVVSQDSREVMMHTQTTLYSGPAAQAAFTVPEGSRVVYLNFKAWGEVRLEGACLSGGEKIPLNYLLLPDFISNRLQGLWANENAIQRTVFFADGMELFKTSPVAGLGLGAFESASWGVQEFDYETKYVHDHYIQVLLDSGILGLAFFLAFVLSLGVGLWKNRKRQDEFTPWLAPCAALWCFILGHAIMEVTLSTGCYLPFAFGCFGIMSRAFGQPLRGQTEPSAQTDPVGTIRNARAAAPTASKSPLALGVRLTALALCSVYLVLLGLNMIVSTNMHKAQSSYEDFYSALKADIALDAFERNDALLSYVINAPTLGDAETLEKADTYAARLCRVRSNSIQNYLVAYYLKRDNVPMALTAALNGAGFNRASQEVWNSLFATFHTYLLGDQAEDWDFDRTAASQAVLTLYDHMQTYNDTLLWAPIQLDDTAQALVEWCRGQ